MGTVSSQVVGALAVLPPSDVAPRVIQQFTSVFLVSRTGELWRVYDSDATDGTGRKMPSAGLTPRSRVFIAIAQTSEVRVRRFRADEAHGIRPDELQVQLDGATLLTS